MADQRTSSDRPGSGVSVVEREIPDETWQNIGLDLAALRAEANEARRRWDASVSTTRSWTTPPLGEDAESRPAEPAQAPGEPPPREPRRVPAEDIIVIGRITPELVPKKGFWRELFFLAILAITLYGAFYSGRMNGSQRVIVIPIPESRHSVIT